MEFFKTRSNAPDERQNNSLWLIIYTDMVSNLMIFFLMLYGLTLMTTEDKSIAEASFHEAFGGQIGAIENAVKKAEKGLERKKDIEKRVRSEFSNVEINEDRIRIILPSPVLFDSGNAELKQSTRKTLDDLAGIIASMPENRVVVEGHTDTVPINTPEFKTNRELSSARAFNVIRYLNGKEGIDPRQLSAIGYGEFRPKVPNDTEANRAINRRIEINIIKPKSGTEA